MGKDEETEFKKPELLDDILEECGEFESICQEYSCFDRDSSGLFFLQPVYFLLSDKCGYHR